MKRFLKQLRRFGRDEYGGEVIEYAMIAALITILLIAGITSIGNSGKQMYENLDQKWDEAAGT